MPKMALGLFENPAVAKRIVQDLETNGLARSGITILAEPAGLSQDSAPGMSTAHTDFEVNLVRDLTRAGVRQEEAQQYREGVRRGGVLVMAQGADSLVDAAAETMDCAGALRVEELIARPFVRGAGQSATPETTAPAQQSGRVRSRGGGARVFVW